ncbi:MAG: hypothetical protein ACXWOL_01625 [Ktedonobacteraceae bacterium]
MQGRQSQGYDPRDRASGKLLATSNGNDSGKQRAIPQRPPGMPRVENPPQTPRVARPQRQPKQTRSLGRRLIFIALIFVACAVIAGIVGFGLVNYFTGIGNSAGAANTATDFMLALKSQNYDQAYNNDLDAKITISVTKDEFKQLALADDHCFGVVTDFNEVPGSAVSSTNDSTQSYTYSVSRAKLTNTYKLTLTLQKDPDGNWDITSYGGDLGPTTPTCK